MHFPKWARPFGKVHLIVHSYDYLTCRRRILIILPVRILLAFDWKENMNTVATTKMSSKGQIVIPEEIRNSLHLKAGTRFVVVGEGDVVVLKTISPPSFDEFDEIVLQARQAAIESGMEPKDIEDAIGEVRSKNASRSRY